MMVTFIEASGVTFKKNVVTQGMKNSNSFKNYTLIWSHSFKC